jgi:4-carboxymuconolactone decarboxylase
MQCRNKQDCPGVVAGKKCPGVSTAERLGPEFGRLLADYHARIWGQEGAVPFKYKYLMALATAVTGRERDRALLEARKALAYGATPEEVRETLELGVWLGGSPLLMEVVGHVLRFVDKQGDAEPSAPYRPAASRSAAASADADGGLR